MRRDFRGIELNGYFAKQLMIFFVETAFHNRLLLKLWCGAASCPLIAGGPADHEESRLDQIQGGFLAKLPV
jgi:hypothetical protein